MDIITVLPFLVLGARFSIECYKRMEHLTARACLKSSNYGCNEHLKHLLVFHRKLTCNSLLTLRSGVLYVRNNGVGGGGS